MPRKTISVGAVIGEWQHQNVRMIMSTKQCDSLEKNIPMRAEKFSELISYLRKGKSKVPVLISQPFLWEKPVVCKAIEKTAAELNAMVMDMSGLSQDLSFRAIGKFEHSGVAAHPSDKGMKRIADRIYRNLTKVL